MARSKPNDSDVDSDVGSVICVATARGSRPRARARRAGGIGRRPGVVVVRIGGCGVCGDLLERAAVVSASVAWGPLGPCGPEGSGFAAGARDGDVAGAGGGGLGDGAEFDLVLAGSGQPMGLVTQVVGNGGDAPRALGGVGGGGGRGAFRQGLRYEEGRRGRGESAGSYRAAAGGRGGVGGVSAWFESRFS